MGDRWLPAWNRGVWVLLADQAMMNIGFFMLFPLLTVHLTRDLGFDATGVRAPLAPPAPAEAAPARR